MYGVVLWSDSKRNKAVIWCEDHQNLAFFKCDRGGREGSRFVPGDLVEFDLREENELRLAVDPCLVAPHEYPALAADLQSATAGMQRDSVGLPRPEGGQPRTRSPGASAQVVVLHPGTPAAKNRLAARACG